MNTPNTITMIRIALTPVFMALLLLDIPYGNYIALAVFLIASLTDGLDGYIARKYNKVTTFGKFVDPLADKLLVCAAILIFVQMGKMPAVAAMLIISRDFVVTSLRVVAMSENVVIAAALSGKFKMVTQVVSISVMLTGLSEFYLIPEMLSVNTLCVWVMTLVTVYSGVDYVISNWGILKSGARK